MALFHDAVLLAMQCHCEASCRRNCTGNIALQPVTQRRIVKLHESTFGNVANQVVTCKVYMYGYTHNDLRVSCKQIVTSW